MEILNALAIGLLSMLALVYGFFKYNYQYWKLRGVPHDKPLFPFGSFGGVGRKYNIHEMLKIVYDKFKPTGAKLCGVYFFARPAALILDLDLIKNIFVKDFTNFIDRGIYYNEEVDPLSAHLVFVDGEKWKKLRAKLTPTFTSGKMKYMFPTVIEVGERFRECVLDACKQNSQLDIKDFCARFTTDVIGTCAFGIECNSLKNPNTEFRHYGRKAVETMPVFGFIFRAAFKNIAKKFRLRAHPENITSFFRNVVQETVEYREQNNISRKDFMDLMIKLKNSTKNTENAFTFNELAAQAFIFFMAGFETSSTALLFCLHELAQNSEIQSKARRVIQQAYQKYNGELTYEMMMDMPYIDQVLEETLRKHPPLTFTARRTINDYHVPGTDIVLEKETACYIPFYAIHHDPEYYPNPEKFDPDRFDSETKKDRDSMAWLPFGGGPRNCIGLRFGMMQARIGLIILLNNFVFSIGPKTNVPIITSKKTFSLTPEHDVYLDVKPLQS